jgi:hypothetical protein
LYIGKGSGDGVGIVFVVAFFYIIQRDGAVHGPRVDVQHAETVCQGTCGGAFAYTDGAVYSHGKTGSFVHKISTSFL